MQLSRMLANTLREDPAEAEIASHKLLYRGGFIRKSAGGIYTYMPMALRVLRKISQIVREEMDKKGGQELQLPMLQPAEPWKETKRWSEYGSEMFKLKDRHDRDFCLGPTHEEIITTLAKGEIRSYKQLPSMLYQIANKYRDEIRPRFGLMRGREFIMKDLYSFDADAAGLDSSYAKMHDAYCRIFERCGLDYRAVEADAGLIGGSSSHEFMVMAESGEAEVAYCGMCSYAANLEKAECGPSEGCGSYGAAYDGMAGADGPREVHTPGAKSIDQVAEYLGCAPQSIIKTLLFTDGSHIFAALVRGDHNVNEVKLSRLLGGAELRLASDSAVEEATGAPVGFAGPIGLNPRIRVIADQSVAGVRGGVVGANKADAHLVGVIPGADFSLGETADIRMAAEGDACPRCGQGRLRIMRGIEVGHIFKLGTKYSEPLDAVYLDQSGQEKPLVMGCYGIGISRTMAAAVEQNHDGEGIIWPMAIAPYHAVVIPVSAKDSQQMAAGEAIHRRLSEAGIEAVMDDRDERPGVKFKDADLIGYPIRITVGPKALAEGQAELKLRREKEQIRVDLEDVAVRTVDLVKAEVR